MMALGVAPRADRSISGWPLRGGNMIKADSGVVDVRRGLS
jgi:hypothetical protein